MAHEISRKNGIAEFAYVGARPWWYGLEPGMTVEPSATEVDDQGRSLGLTTTHPDVRRVLGWDVALRKVRFDYVDERGPGLASMPDRFVIERTDLHRGLGIVGTGYRPIPNRVALEVADALLAPFEGAGLTPLIETVGVLRDGATVFVLCKLPTTFEPAPGDPVETYLLLLLDHSGNRTFRLLFTPVRVVCANTERAALKGSPNVVKVRHDATAAERIEEAKAALTASKSYFDRVKVAFAYLTTRKVTDEIARLATDQLFPAKEKVSVDGSLSLSLPNAASLVLANFQGAGAGSALPGSSGTAWGWYNAVTAYLDHGRATASLSNSWEASQNDPAITSLRDRAFNLALSL